MQLTSPAFRDGEMIPRRYTEDGGNFSPPLRWSGLPPKTVEVAIICEDPDAPQAKAFVHWIIYGVPADLRELSEGVAPVPDPPKPEGARQGVNSYKQKRNGYRGPAPGRDGGAHRYYFTLYALDRKLNLASGVEKDALLHALKKVKVLGTAQLMGRYQREAAAA